MSKTITIEGYYDETLSWEELSALAFDPSTPDDLATHYQERLRAAKNSPFNKEEDNFSRHIFLMNPTTKKIRIWFD